jgi:two-component system, LytTR family, sensor kinase
MVPAAASFLPPDRPRRTLAAAFLALWLLNAVQVFLVRLAAGEAGSFSDTLLVSAAAWWPWFVAAQIIAVLDRRLASGARLLWALAHLGLFLAVHVIAGAVLLWLSRIVYSSEDAWNWGEAWRALFGGPRFIVSLCIYGGVIGVMRAAATRAALRERELQAARLEAQATRARLDALAARLEPHFLFNALQSVSALVEHEPLRARTMLAQIGDLLRDALAVTDQGEITLREEIALLQRYLAIETTRFADRLRVTMACAPDAEGARVPRFLLQPLVENAIRHGIAPRPEGGEVRITATRRGDRVRLEVWNNGTALRDGVRDGVGLATTRERLATRYGAAASLTLGPTPEGHVAAVVELPA